MAWMLAAILNFSAFRWVALPCPAEAKFKPSLRLLAAAKSSGRVLMFLDGDMTKTLDKEEIGA